MSALTLYLLAYMILIIDLVISIDIIVLLYNNPIAAIPNLVQPISLRINRSY
jgi:hypothetical protein